jgi:predicted PurR-regulated permease PerM
LSDKKKILYAICMVLLAIATAKAFVELQKFLICLIMAITLGAAMAPIADRAQSKGIPRFATVILIYLMALVVYAGVVWSLWPILAKQSRDLIASLPDIIHWLIAKTNNLSGLLEPIIDISSLKSMPEELMGASKSMAINALKFTGNLLTLLINGIFILFLAAYFTIEGPTLMPALIKWLPHKARPRAQSLIAPLIQRLGGYVRGQLLVSLCVGSIIAAGLCAIGVESALVLGVISGLLNLVPFIGSFITLSLATVIGFKQAIWMGFAVLGLFAIEQWIESNFIVPNLLGKQVDLDPLVVLFAVVIGGTLLGVEGALIAVPTATLTIFFLEEFYYKPLNEGLGLTQAE